LKKTYEKALIEFFALQSSQKEEEELIPFVRNVDYGRYNKTMELV